jgi:hypothetical protein
MDILEKGKEDPRPLESMHIQKGSENDVIYN